MGWTGAELVQAWFQGMNPHLDHMAPARVLREQDLHQGGPAVIAAARSFAARNRGVGAGSAETTS